MKFMRFTQSIQMTYVVPLGDDKETPVGPMSPEDIAEMKAEGLKDLQAQAKKTPYLQSVDLDLLNAEIIEV